MLESGVYPASVTPLTPDGAVDLPSMVRLLSFFQAAGCQGAVLAGTNGEGPSLSALEKRDLARACVPILPDFKIVLGISTPSITEAVWLANQANKAGAAAGLVMAPGYFREASEEAICRWFEELFSETELPILVYNFPQRTGITFTNQMIERLAQHPQMIGLKDSSGNEANIPGYAGTAPDKLKFVGNEALLIAALEAGWSGTISGAANCIPAWLSAVTRDWQKGDFESARAKFQLCLPGIEALRGVPQPATNKAVLHKNGVLPNATVRLPLEDLQAESLQVAWERLQGLLD